jgi:hypothetical protein
METRTDDTLEYWLFSGREEVVDGSDHTRAGLPCTLGTR